MNRALRQRDFSRAKLLSPAFFRATNPHLDGAEFAVKWKTARISALRFFRSFAQAWQVDFLDINAAQLDCNRCWCFGDAHLENFGVLTFRDGPAFVCNDLDDSGPGNPLIDALRYFTSLGLADIQPQSRLTLLNHYIDGIYSDQPPAEPPSQLWPSLEASDRAELKRWCKDNTFRFSVADLQLTEVNSRDENAIVRALQKSIDQAHYTVLAIAGRQRDGGGSGGLERFLVLAKDDHGATDLLEFKETTRAATAWGNQLREPEDRLERAIKELWPGLVPKCYREVVVGRRRFLLRSRLGRLKLQFDEYNRKDRDVVLGAQVGILARQHRVALHAQKPKALREWLDESSKVTVDRWHAIYELGTATETT